MPKILIIEDDTDINNMICEFLTEHSFSVVQAFSGTEARLLFDLQFDFSLIIMDLMLPGISGENLLTEIRSSSNIPIIILSAKNALDDKVELLAKGADDYLTKPFALEELLVRIQVQLRHQKDSFSLHRTTYKDWTLDLDSRRLLIGTRSLEFTAHEFDILALLMQRPTKVFTKQEIYESVWGEAYVIEDKTINVHISNIRTKLKDSGTADYIQTVWGIGFKLS
ncbi:response regulator transcription factor [Mediterraneibacter massiliensis]|uniref:response regulator transcription factor n=1 Tax=Mediterraneibacter massiliensis TaxID=1720300 RepID=UPI0022E81334|nr:response regulator transcription factor [Mediterraneibacter massiliensis]